MLRRAAGVLWRRPLSGGEAPGAAWRHATAWRPPGSGASSNGDERPREEEDSQPPQQPPPPPKDPHRDAVVASVGEACRAIGLHPGIDCVLGDGLATADLGLVISPGNGNETKVAIDIIDTQGSDSGSGGPGGRGAVMAKQRLLSHLGWKSASIRAADWESIGNDPEKQQRFIALVLEHAVGEGGSHSHGGGGHTCGPGCGH